MVDTAALLAAYDLTTSGSAAGVRPQWSLFAPAAMSSAVGQWYGWGRCGYR